MDWQQLDNCDAEVGMSFPENFRKPKEFTIEPKRYGSPKPVPLHLRPPLLRVCGMDCTNDMPFKRAFALTRAVKAPVGVTIPNIIGSQQELPKISHNTEVQDTELSVPLTNSQRDENRICSSSEVLQKKVVAIRSELERIRRDLQTTKLYVQSLEHKDKELGSRTKTYKTVNLTLDKKYEILFNEKMELHNEMGGQGDGHGNHSGKSGIFGSKRRQNCGDFGEISLQDKKDLRQHVMECGLGVDTESGPTLACTKTVSSEITVHKKKSKMCSLLKQMRNVFRSLRF